jgi:hypothetical protein
VSAPNERASAPDLEDLDSGWEAEEDEPEEPEEPEPPGLTRQERNARAAARKERGRLKAAAKKERRRSRALTTAGKQKQKKPRLERSTDDARPPSDAIEPPALRAEEAPVRTASTRRLRRDWQRMAMIVAALVLLGGTVAFLLVRN